MTLHVEQFTMTVWAPEGDVPPPVTPPVTRTMRFAAGTTGNRWRLAPSVVDSGNELRSKTVKATHATGKFTNAFLQVYTWDVTQDINVTDLENGTGSITGNIDLPDTTQVQQTVRYQVNCPNADLSNLCIEGEWDGIGIPDRIDELVLEIAVQGARR